MRLPINMELSIIIVSYNTKLLLLDCVASIVKYTKNLAYEIVVVDNGSTDGSVEALKANYAKSKWLRIIQNKENKGFGAANNQGIDATSGTYVLLLNSDTLVGDNCLTEMVEWLEKHPKVGVASCALKNVDGTMQGTGGYFPTLAKVFTWMFFVEDIPFLDRLIRPFHPVHGQSFFYRGTSQYTKPREQDWVTGAFMLIPKKVLGTIGTFDEDYFMYTEEVDLCYRIKSAGLSVWYLPKWSITHLGSASSTREFPLLQEYKSIKLFYQKHMPTWHYPILRVFLKCGALLRIVLFGLLKGRQTAQIYAKAFTIA
jgi:GT2 family glycosyltransferase